MSDKTLLKTPFLRVVDRSGWVFVAEADRAVLLPYFVDRTQGTYYLVREEPVPCHSPSRHLCAVAGTVEPGEDPVDTAVRELGEETGYYNLPAHRLIPLGWSYVTKGASNRAFFFACDVTGLRRGVPSGDGSAREAVSTTRWMTKRGLRNQVPCALTLACCARFEQWVEDRLA